MRCRRRGSMSTCCACGRSRSAPPSTASSPSTRRVFVVEQNRDAQLRMMIVNEQEVDPAKLEPILHYDGTPITARFIIEAIAERVRADNVEPIAKKGLAA